jgi:nicotinate (nicotinamide) nucleotide adenylyltransferase
MSKAKAQSDRSLQSRIAAVYSSSFGSTPLSERLDIIFREAIELRSFRDVKNLKEETGDILTAVIQLATESGWDVSDLVDENLVKISRRKLQYLSQGRKIRVAILGGSFDPPTTGHVGTMEFILKACGKFDEVWMLPCHSHKFNKIMESPKHRLAMCRLALQNNPRLKVFDYEIVHRLAGDTYTFVKRLLDEKFAKDRYDFSLVIGLDNANTMHTWVNWNILIDMIQFVVVQRAGVKRDPKVNWYLKEPHLYLEHEGDIPMISSTEVREDLWLRNCSHKCRESALSNIGKDVMDYIDENRLYLIKNANEKR